ncbi:putative Phosphatidylinositol-4-phosphate 5-kinase [Giardia muris]|uniref:Putative Phosphatidylinositol-4-phosphate 5-kinase n=1 Tax=Giardia muris TaxID=5742 RepID=A0A4Z1T5U5_GIAMU|nr:putative Phosphatidylinositol-4-phosphate 5-kinase [Giardia muris]|eukprot:TNJ28507.1 putative Phosphatidylinositol-4-phosphate 5-kinase [Giardia muris]
MALPGISTVRAIFSPDGSAYKGTWYNSLRHGYGTHVYPNGDCYTGEWANNLPHGYGEFYSAVTKKKKHQKKTIPEAPDSSSEFTLVYAGYWMKGERHGFGKYFYGPNERYEGQWHQGLRSGFGCHFYPETINQENILLAREEHAKELERFKDNPLGEKHLTIYSDYMRTSLVPGVHKDEARVTVLPSKYPFGCVYKGNWNADRCHGLGRLIFPNGDVFVGNFVNDHAYGIGVRYYVDTRRVTNGFYDSRGQCVCSQTRSDFNIDDLKIVLAVWTEPCAPYVSLSESVRSLIRTALGQDEEFARLCSTANPIIQTERDPNPLLRVTDMQDMQDVQDTHDLHEVGFDTARDSATYQDPHEDEADLFTTAKPVDSVIFHQGKAFSPGRRIPSSLAGSEHTFTRYTHSAGGSQADPESALYNGILQRASSQLSEKLGSEYDALESAFAAHIVDTQIPVRETSSESVLSQYSSNEYPYIYQPPDELFNISMIRRLIGNVPAMARELPIHCAPIRTDVDQLLDLPLEADAQELPILRLANSDAPLLETLQNLVGTQQK